MASGPGAPRRRKSVERHKALEYRQARVDVHEDLGDWFLGPRPEDHEFDEECRFDYAALCGSADELALAISHLLSDLLQLDQRVALPEGLRQLAGRESAHEPPGSAAFDDAGLLAGSALESHALQWARRLLSAPTTLCQALAGDDEELAAARALARRLLGPGHAVLSSGEPFPDASWSRALALAMLSYPMWARPLSRWPGDTPQSLVEHLLLDYATPPVLLEWLMRVRLVFAPGQPQPLSLMPLIWYAARASGCSVHRLLNGLDERLFALSAGEIAALERVPALSDEWSHDTLRGHAELLRLGGNEQDWQRLRSAPIYTRFPPPGDPRDGTWWLPLEPFRATLQWLIRQRDALTDAQAADVLAWSLDQRDQARCADQPPFSWAGRTARSALAAAEAHWLARSRARADADLCWPARGWDFECVDDDAPGSLWRMRELLSTEALVHEGATQRHCVAAYARACAAGGTAIFQLSLDGARRLTVEVSTEPAPPRVVQARGRFNCGPDDASAAMLRRWTAAFGLAIEPYAW